MKKSKLRDRIRWAWNTLRDDVSLDELAVRATRAGQRFDVEFMNKESEHVVIYEPQAMVLTLRGELSKRLRFHWKNVTPTLWPGPS